MIKNLKKRLKTDRIPTMGSLYTVKTEVFEGPLDMLLSLIEKRKLFINDISLAAVADDYIAHTRELKNLPVGYTANFILIASTLVLIKSKSLLPSLKLTEEEEANIEDLEERLKEYKRIKELSIHIEKKFGKNIIFPRMQSKHREPIFSPDEKMTIGNLLFAVKSIVASLPKKESIPQAVVKKVVSLEKTIENLAKRIQNSLSMSFKEFAGVGRKEKTDIVVGFLAMLELVKQGTIDVMQSEHFGDINMESKEIGVPKYM
jgi:segregation and condensation protein A